MSKNRVSTTTTIESSSNHEKIRRFRGLWTVPAALLLALCGMQYASKSLLSSEAASIPANAGLGQTENVGTVRGRQFDYAMYLEHAELLSTDTAQITAANNAIAHARLLAPNEPLVLRGAYRVAVASGDMTAALSNATRLADISPADRVHAFAGIAALVESPIWERFFLNRLKERWQSADPFLRYLCEKRFDSSRLLSLAQMAQRNQQVQTTTLHCIENALVTAGYVETAYTFRLVSRMPGQRIDYLSNGEFDEKPSGSPFDWRITAGGEYRAGFDAAIRTGTDFGRVGSKLVVRFNGRPIKTAIAQQYLALFPGHYTLTTVSTTTGLAPDSRPEWRISCVGSSSAPIAIKSDSGNLDGAWQRMESSFAIASGCTGQLLTFQVGSRLATLEGAKGVAIVDSILIERRQ
jgi:hypothetical protein